MIKKDYEPPFVYESFYPERQEPDEYGRVFVNKDTYTKLKKGSDSLELTIQMLRKEIGQLNKEISRLEKYEEYFKECDSCQRVERAIENLKKEWY